MHPTALHLLDSNNKWMNSRRFTNHESVGVAIRIIKEKALNCTGESRPDPLRGFTNQPTDEPASETVKRIRLREIRSPPFWR